MKSAKKRCLVFAFMFAFHSFSMAVSISGIEKDLSPSIGNLPDEVCQKLPGNKQNEPPAKNISNLYEKLKFDSLGLGKEAFQNAVEGYTYLLSIGTIANKEVISIVDFSKHSSKKRLFVIDLENGKLLFNTYVAHGRNSGKYMATAFSNNAESKKSCLGFFVTGDTYMGMHGFSLRLSGLEKGINDNAYSRAIVVHGAAYVSEEAIRLQGFVGRSFGCPALPTQLSQPIIETIKGGSCLFIYSTDKFYSSQSTILKKS